MNDIKIFENTEFGQIRTVAIDNEPMFCLGDLCKALELTAKGVKQRLNDEVISNYPIEDSLGRMQNTLFVNEDGLYDVILESRKDSAKKFRKWVTSEVLPSIRKHGGYIQNQNNLSDTELLAKAVLIAQSQIQEKDLLIQKQQLKIEGDKDKVAFAEAVEESINSITVGEFAKMLSKRGIRYGRNHVYAWLRNNGYLQSSKAEYNLPFQIYINAGTLEVATKTFKTKEGTTYTYKETRITGKGQPYFINKIKNEFALLQ